MGLNDGADFYAKNLEELRREGNESWHLFLEECECYGVSRCKNHKDPFALLPDPYIGSKPALRRLRKYVSAYLYAACRASGCGGRRDVAEK